MPPSPWCWSTCISTLRDLKPANALVSNQHHSGFAGGELERAWNEHAITSKLADFGESRYKDIQTNTILNSHT